MISAHSIFLLITCVSDEHGNITHVLAEDTYYGDGLNLYQYCQANPVGYVDPSGHSVCPVVQNHYDQYQEYRKQHPEATDADLSQYRQYEVIKPFEVEASTIAPAFNKIGLGTQYHSSVSAEILVKKGIIKLVGGYWECFYVDERGGQNNDYHRFYDEDKACLYFITMLKRDI